MKKYVVGFMFDDMMQKVVMIRKNRPEWQAGLLNGVGGHTEDGEKPIDAMNREFFEETGVVTVDTDWAHVCTLRFPYAEVDFFAAKNTALLRGVRTKTDEEVSVFWVGGTGIFRNAGTGCSGAVIENIPPLLELSKQRLTDREGVAP